MKKFTLMLLSMAFGLTTAMAQTDVTIHVNMNWITDLYEGGEVWVYMDDDWEEYYTMTDEDADGIYTYTVAKDEGSSLYYRFSYQNGPDPWTNYFSENVPAECAAENGFRELIVPGTATELPAYAFGSCDLNPSSKVTVTFQVDMSDTTVLNNEVWVVIKDPWIWTQLADQGNGVWSASTEVDPNETYPYTFVNGGQDNWEGEESLPDECNYGTPSAPERRVTVEMQDTVLNLVKYAECDMSVTDVNVTFRVNMANVTDLYEGGAVWVYMDDDWTEYYDMLDEDEDGIYSFTLQSEVGTLVTYKFSYQTGPDPWSDYVTESLSEECTDENGFRFFTVPLIDHVLPAFAYGSCNETPVPTLHITFQVDMSETEVINNEVWVVIKDPWIWTQLSDQGNGIWSGNVEVQVIDTYPYTFVNGGQDNWEGEESVPMDCNFGTETAPERHVEVGTEDVVLPPVLFGSCAYTSVDLISITDVNLFYPNPAKDFIFMNREIDDIQSIQIIDMSGRHIATFGPRQNNITSIDLRHLGEGLYFVVINAQAARYTQKILINR